MSRSGGHESSIRGEVAVAQSTIAHPNIVGCPSGVRVPLRILSDPVLYVENKCVMVAENRMACYPENPD